MLSWMRFSVAWILILKKDLRTKASSLRKLPYNKLLMVQTNLKIRKRKKNKRRKKTLPNKKKKRRINRRSL